ncbi:PDZ and LIM domain protein Zasp isoform X2 [Plodia interpunctella]|uniref:PDZ and LIM domain protein Zasp isoform X2 n=1 Tax=Plodia interpunctella TaxID=58824 RepID=UPI002368D843|nr:PDZ and LIM domain protein Zasp isoform X2 [Plodia interpunctella]
MIATLKRVVQDTNNQVNGGSAAERAGLQAGDALIRVNNTDVYTLRHQDAQDAIRAAGGNLELTVQRGGGTWRPSVTPTGSLPRPGSRPLGASPVPVTSTSLKANPQPSRAFGSGHNNVAKPFGYMNGNDSVKSIVNKQYNTPVNMYSDKTIAETLSAQTEVLAGGVLGVNFKKNEKTYDAEKSAVFKVLQEEQNDPEPEPSHFYSRASVARAGTPCSLHRTHRSRSRTPRVMSTPQPQPPPQPPTPVASAGTQTPAMEQLAPEQTHRPSIPVGCHQVLPDGRIALGAPAVPQPHGSLPVVNDTPYCSDCNRYIVGVFVRIKDKNLHVECFKCSTCGTSLKNQGYYNLNGKLYCDIHAKLVARQNPPAPNLEPVTVPPGGRLPTNSYSTPLPPLATNNNYLNGTQSMFSPSSNLSGPKPFGSSIGSAYSPSLSPRSAPMSPARPLAAPVAPAPAPQPLPTQAAHTPFAPTQNVKNIVWPPQNPQGDVPPMPDPSPKLTNKKVSIEPTPTMVIPCVEKDDNVHLVQNTFSSSQQIAEYTSSVSYASTTMSTVNSMSSKSTSESKQNKQSKEIHETSSCVVQSVSEQESSKQKSMTIYQSQTSPPIQTSYENPTSHTELQQKLEKSLVKEEIQSEMFAEKQYFENAIVTPEKITSKENNPEQDKKNKDCEKSKIITEQKNIITEDISEIQQGEIRTKQDANKVIEINPTIQQSQIQVNEAKCEINYDVTEKQSLTISSESNKTLQSITRNDADTTNITVDQYIQGPPDQSILGIPQGPPAHSMIDALTTASDRPYSPLPTTSIPLNTFNQCTYDQHEEKVTDPLLIREESANSEREYQSRNEFVMPSQPSPMFAQPKRGISPIAPIKAYNPPEKKEVPIPMPEETKPYIPPDFKINIEPKVPRAETSSPMVDALTTAPNRPFTPVQMQPVQPIQRGSLRDALTIAPDRPFSPMSLNMTSQSSCYTSTSSVQVQSANTTSEIIRPIATQTSTQITSQTHSEFSNTLQNTCQLQSSTNMSAFRPVAKQVFPPPQPEEFCKLTNFPPITDDLKSSFEQSTQETIISESKSMQHSTMTTSSMSAQGFSSVKNAQSFFEQLEQKESLSSANIRSKSGLHKADNIPPYQKNFDRLPSQRGITPEICLAPAVLQRPVTPTTDPPTKPRDKSQEPKSNFQTSNQTEVQIQKHSQLRTPIQQTPVQFNRNTPISMTFQPVSDENVLRVSPARSRPSTPSMINKPAPIIPHYQMNLVSVEHTAAESYLHDPSSREGSRSPTPKLRSRSPAQGPPPNPLKAQAPRLKENTPQRQVAHSLLTQATSNLRKEHELAQFQMNANSITSSSFINHDQPSIISEQRHSNIGYKSENYVKGDMRVKEDSMMNKNYGQKETHSQNVSEYGNKTVQTTRKTFEEFERTQSAKVVEIRKGCSSFISPHQQADSNFRQSNTNAKQVFPPPVMSLPSSQQNSSINVTNEGRSIESYPTLPSISGANQGPVCDPTPSTGSSVGAAARGKTFGVSSAPKRGRGVLNKAAVPGSRVPLCASCNGNIRGPFITALGRIWCPEHFICVNATCRRPLQDIGFVEENGQLYCEYCFEQYIAPACDKCHAKIKGDCLNAIGKHFHPECFNCVYCGKLFGNNPFFLEDGLPYCEADWNELFTTKCFACGFPVEAGDRCAKRTSKDRVSSPREADLSAKYMLANNPQVIYNSDTVYSTTTFRPVSPSPITPTIPDAPSPQRTRKLETPLHFDGGLFSDIRSTDGKLLSRVTVDRVHSSTRHDVTDSPCVFETIGPHIGNKDYVDDIVKTESITNEDVIKVKFTPVPQDLDPPRLLTPSQFRVNQTRTPIEYLKDNYEDLQSYKIVSSLCKEKNIGHDIASSREKDVEHLIMSEPYVRAHSPLANLLVSEQLTKIDHYLQDRLDACSINDKVHGTSDVLQKMRETVSESNEKEINKTYEDKTYYFESSTSNNFGSYQETQKNADGKKEPTPQRHSMNENQDEIKKKFEVKNYEFENNVTSKTKPIEKRGGILNVIYKMPIHYHAAILCFILIVYNLIYQYIKQNCLGNKK